MAFMATFSYAKTVAFGQRAGMLAAVAGAASCAI